MEENLLGKERDFGKWEGALAHILKERKGPRKAGVKGLLAWGVQKERARGNHERPVGGPGDFDL